MLDNTLSAIFGAVWLDCEYQNKSASDTRLTTLKVLRQMHLTVIEAMTAMDGEIDPIFQDRNHRTPATTLATSSPALNAGLENSVNDMEAFMQKWFMQVQQNELDYVKADPPIGHSIELGVKDGEGMPFNPLA